MRDTSGSARETATPPGRLRKGLAAASEQVARGTGEVADESDRWFLGGIRLVDRGLRLGLAGVARAGHQLGRGWTRVRDTHFPPDPPRVRLQKAIAREAKRMRARTDAADFQAFSTNMATLVELVLAGTIALEDVGFAFEDDAAASRSEHGEEGHDPTPQVANADPACAGTRSLL